MKYKCKECNNLICSVTFKYGSGLCKYCAFKGERNPGFKDGRTLIKHYCIDCDKKLHSKTKTGKCKHCSRLENTNAKNSGHSKRGKFNSHFGKPASNGKHIKYKGIWMRSSWETLFAQFLTLSGHKWLYESKTFDLGEMTYTPDFYLPEFDCYIEIKGFWWKKQRQKFDSFLRMYPKANINLLMKAELQELGILK